MITNPRSFLRLKTFAGLFAYILLTLPVVHTQPLPSIEEKTDSLTKMAGYFPLYWEESAGKVWLEIPRMGEDFLYVVSLPAGLGSNDIGLDRGQLGGERVVRFERVGPKVLLIQRNLQFRAETDVIAERQAVEDAFAESVVWSFTAAAETGERVLVDATNFIVRDAHGVVQRLRDSQQGSFSLDSGRSTPFLVSTRAFPENTEMEARLTFVSDNPGGFVRSVAADPGAITMRVRHSFVKLPPPGYEPRPFDPRSGFFGIEYVDYAAPLHQPKEKRFIARHRLRKKDPRARVSEPVEPIVYYLDPGTPEPVRSALLEGANWWNEAFEAAGFRNAFRVELLPVGADPMDVRYNTIQWVHRSTRGWSYGSTVIDPRTGEIIKGHVTLGSLRVRQDYLIAQGLLSPFDADFQAGTEDDPMQKMALARIRQLSAHEVGHTLGLAHNYAASTNERASVMDYPAPLVTINNNGTLSLTEAYGTGVGAWDKSAIQYGYSDFPEGIDSEAALANILEESRKVGLRYISDADARPSGAAQPYAHLWDNGLDVIQALDHEMEVRRIALTGFGEKSIPVGQPLATLEEVLVPIYLWHRYQVDAVGKLIGGVEYTYAVRGDRDVEARPVPGNVQLQAIDALLQTVRPEALRLPEYVRALVLPRPPGYGPHRELFDGYSDPIFDPYAPAEGAAALVMGQILQPERLARLIYQHDFDPGMPGMLLVLTRVSEAVIKHPAPENAYDAELQRLVQNVWIEGLIRLASNTRAAVPVRARTTAHLGELRDWLTANPEVDSEASAHRAYVVDRISRYLDQPYQPEDAPRQINLPPGAPIGSNENE